LGRLHLSAGELDEAARDLNEAARLRPTLAEVHVALGRLYERENSLGKAEGAYREALRLQPNLSDAHYSLGQLLRSQGKYREAQDEVAKGESQQRPYAAMGTANALNSDGLKQVHEGHLREASETFAKALAADPTFFMAAYNQGVVLGRMGRTQDAIAAFRTAIRLRPDFVLGHYGLGLLLRSTGDASAESELARARLLKQYVAQPLGRDVLMPTEAK
jgi:tetratricopeptide (TPR) repeat protein